jgi:hypothetical protein
LGQVRRIAPRASPVCGYRGLSQPKGDPVATAIELDSLRVEGKDWQTAAAVGDLRRKVASSVSPTEARSLVGDTQANPFPAAAEFEGHSLFFIARVAMEHGIIESFPRDQLHGEGAGRPELTLAEGPKLLAEGLDFPQPGGQVSTQGNDPFMGSPNHTSTPINTVSSVNS